MVDAAGESGVACVEHIDGGVSDVDQTSIRPKRETLSQALMDACSCGWMDIETKQAQN